MGTTAHRKTRYVLRYASSRGATCLQELRKPPGSCKLLISLMLGLWHGRGHRFDPDQVHQLNHRLRDDLAPHLGSILVANSKTLPRTGCLIAVFFLSEEAACRTSPFSVASPAEKFDVAPEKWTA